jgi:hypothetical protein
MDAAMTFGQHEGRTMSWVLKNDVSYTRWCIDRAAEHGVDGKRSCAGYALVHWGPWGMGHNAGDNA